MDRSVGLIVALLGGVVVLVGLAIWAGALSWFGRLPGDIRLGGERSRISIPLTSSLLLSIVATVLINLVIRLFR